MARTAQPRHLPPPQREGGASLMHVLGTRRSVREFSETSLTLADVAQLLWAAQGITHEPKRTAPSAGALYPLELYLVATRVDDLAPGIYHYRSAGHSLQSLFDAGAAPGFAAAALDQAWVADAAAVLVFTAVQRRTTVKYGDRGVRYIHIEVGHAAQNVLLQATALDLAAVGVGAFDDGEVSAVLRLPPERVPLYLLAVGRP